MALVATFVNRLWEHFCGNVNLPFEHRQTILVTSCGVLLSATASLVNHITNQSRIMTAACIAGTAGLYLLRVRLQTATKLTPYIVVLVSLGLALAVTGWFTSEGIFGSAPYIFFLILTWLLAIVRQKNHLGLIGGFAGVSLSLIILQLFFPQWVIPYPDATAKVSDLAIGIVATLVFQAFFISGLRRHFEEALEARSNFIVAMSHELRTPLTSMIAGAQMLAEDGGKTNPEETGKFIERSAQALLRHIDDLLTLRAHNLGAIPISESPYCVREIFNDLARQYGPAAEAKGLTLECLFRDGIPDFLLGDGARISQIISVLTANAIKHSNSGRVRVSAQVETFPQRTLLVMRVSDNGLGIKKENLPFLFEPFSLWPDNSGSTPHTGVGLAVSLLIARKMGGDLVLEKNSLDGTTFCLSLPLRPYASSFLPQNPTTDLAQKRILIAEDDTMTAMLLRHILESHGATVEAVDNGQHLIERALAGDWHLILTDINMPEANGFEAAERIHAATPASHAPRRIVAVSASTYSEQQGKAEASGIRGWVTKPFSEETLLQQVLRHVK